MAAAGRDSGQSGSSCECMQKVWTYIVECLTDRRSLLAALLVTLLLEV